MKYCSLIRQDLVYDLAEFFNSKFSYRNNIIKYKFFLKGRSKMWKRLNPFIITEEQTTNIELANWIVDSHNWIEVHTGYFECSWCKMQLTSTMGVSIKFPICKENPVIKKLINIEESNNERNN